MTVVSQSQPVFRQKLWNHLRMMTLFDWFSEAIVIVTAYWMKLFPSTEQCRYRNDDQQLACILRCYSCLPLVTADLEFLPLIARCCNLQHLDPPCHPLGHLDQGQNRVNLRSRKAHSCLKLNRIGLFALFAFLLFATATDFK